MVEEKQAEYAKQYSEASLFTKLAKFGKKAGIKVVYVALLLYHTLQKKEVPTKAKAVVLGALGYFILPLDVIPDILGPIGYTDDLSALLVALVTVAMYIDDAIKQKAQENLQKWFGPVDEQELADIHAKL